MARSFKITSISDHVAKFRGEGPLS